MPKCAACLRPGYREIMISGINLRQYAMRDEGCRDFWDLLSYLDRELAPEWGSGARPDPARFRISSVEPAQLTERGIGHACRNPHGLPAPAPVAPEQEQRTC